MMTKMVTKEEVEEKKIGSCVFYILFNFYLMLLWIFMNRFYMDIPAPLDQTIN